MSVARTTTAKNIKFIRKFSDLSQEKFGKLFNITRGMVDSYEREVCDPSTDFLQALASRFKLSVEILTTKDLSVNPGLLISGTATTVKGFINEDLLAAKDETISEQRHTIDYLRKEVARLSRELSKMRA